MMRYFPYFLSIINQTVFLIVFLSYIQEKAQEYPIAFLLSDLLIVLLNI